MIDEDDLRRLLADAAGSVPPPGRAPEALLATLEEEPAPPRSRPRVPKVLAAAAVLVGVIAIAAALIANNGQDSLTQAEATGGRLSDEASPSTTSAAGLGFSDEGSSAGGTQQQAGAADAPAQPAQPPDSAKIIKTGSLDLEVGKGTFEGTVDRVTAKAIGLGGYIAESTTSQSGDAPSGSVVLRVPAEDYEALLTDLRRLGEVKAVTSKGTDVSAQFTDLAARLTALTATRDRLSAVLGQAANVGDILAVQDRITNVQIEIEKIQGQQQLLEDQTSFATLAVTLAEPGAQAEIESEPDPGLGKAWDDARRRFGNGIEGIVSWSGPAALALIVGLILLVTTRLAWINLRRRTV